MVSNTKLSEFFGPHQVPGRELSEFLSAYYLCAKTNSLSLAQNSGAIRDDITNPEQWSAGEIAVLRNQEAKRVRDIGSLIFEIPIRHNYEAGVEVRSLLSTKQLVEIDGRLAVTDEDLHSPGSRFVRFWVDEVPISTEEGRSQGDDDRPDSPRSVRDAPHIPVRSNSQGALERGRTRESPEFGGGVDQSGNSERDSHQRRPIPEGNAYAHLGDHNPGTVRLSPVRWSNPYRTPPEECELLFTFHGTLERMVL